MKITGKFNTVAWTRNWAKAMAHYQYLADRAPNTVAVGVDPAVAAKPHPNADATYTQIGAWMEYGTANAPARPHIRPTFQKRKRVWASMVGKGMVRVASGKQSLEKLMQQMAAQMTKDLKATVMQGVPPPNTPSTVERKGFNFPLVETGAYVQSLTGQVKKT